MTPYGAATPLCRGSLTLWFPYPMAHIPCPWTEVNNGSHEKAHRCR